MTDSTFPMFQNLIINIPLSVESRSQFWFLSSSLATVKWLAKTNSFKKRFCHLMEYCVLHEPPNESLHQLAGQAYSFLKITFSTECYNSSLQQGITLLVVGITIFIQRSIYTHLRRTVLFSCLYFCDVEPACFPADILNQNFESSKPVFRFFLRSSTIHIDISTPV